MIVFCLKGKKKTLHHQIYCYEGYSSSLYRHTVESYSPLLNSMFVLCGVRHGRRPAVMAGREPSVRRTSCPRPHWTWYLAWGHSCWDSSVPLVSFNFMPFNSILISPIVCGMTQHHQTACYLLLRHHHINRKAATKTIHSPLLSNDWLINEDRGTN